MTGSRAEYGLLYWLMKEIQEDRDLELQIAVTGMHLSPIFGLTYKVIEQDGFKINEKIDMQLTGDTSVDIARSMGIATIGFAEAFQRLKPDLLVILGDRYEILAAAQAAMVARIPMAHIHGGEATEGVIDESIRHSLSKMSHFHFVAAETYKRRVIQLGEQPDHVYNFGAIGLDNICNLDLLDKVDLEESLGFELGSKSFLVTYHPVTLSHKLPGESFNELLEALDQFSEYRVVFTMPNSDAEGRIIFDMIRDYAAKNDKRVFCEISLGQLRYLSTMKHVDAVIGNSSSGLIEAPALNKATVNIGERQRGRLKAESVIDCIEKKGEILGAINRVLSLEFQNNLKNVMNPYGQGGASKKIKEVLKTVDLNNVLMKKFYDLKIKL